MKSKSKSQDIYETLGFSLSLWMKSVNVGRITIKGCLMHTMSVLLNDSFCLNTGSRMEGTSIAEIDYHSVQRSLLSNCFSDTDIMEILYPVCVVEEGEALPEEYDNNIYCLAERGKHTTDGFRKLRIIHSPEVYPVGQDWAWQCTNMINYSVEDGYISSAKFLAGLLNLNMPCKHSISVLGVKGPSTLMERDDGSTSDCVRCFYVKTWPKEAETWFMRQTHWPDKQLKNKIKKTGYLLVPTGNSKSLENSLEWRCSFSIAEQILFKSATRFQRYTFIMLKILMKEYLPSDINTDGEKQLSSYHLKTVFLWCLEERKLKWEPENMLGIIGHMLHVLIKWIELENYPHYFIPSVNLLDGRQFHGRKNSLKCVISAIRNDLSNKIRHTQFFRRQAQLFKITQDSTSQDNISPSVFKRIPEAQLFMTCYSVMKSVAGALQFGLHNKVFYSIQLFYKVKFNHNLLIEHILSINLDLSCIDPQAEHLYRALYTDTLHDKLLKEVVPGLMDQYRGCIHLAKYCIAKRDGCLLPNTLHEAESLLKDTLHLDPCSGYVKIACLYIATNNFVQAMDKLLVAEKQFQYRHVKKKIYAIKASEREGVEMYTDFIHYVFQEWVEGLVASHIVVSWPECNTVPRLLQFELIHESTQQVIDIPGSKGKMVGIDCLLAWPPLSMIKLLKFVCAFYSGHSREILEKYVSELIDSRLSLTLCYPAKDTYTIFNMAAWCYLKIKKYKLAAHMVTTTIVSRSDPSEVDVLERCAFSHHLLAHVIAQCLL